MDGLISIIVPIYKVENHLNDCIQSLVDQTYRNIQIILVDDGSPDTCPDICDQWAKRDSRIIVIHKKNGGLSDARNVGLLAASGKYIAFVDGDDYVSKDMYYKMHTSIIANDADVATCGRIIFDDDEQWNRYTLDQEKVFTTKEAVKEILLRGSMEEAAWDKLYKRELFLDIEFPVGEINEDIVTIPWVIHKGNKAVHVGEGLYFYRRNNTGISKSLYNEKKQVVIPHIQAVCEEILKWYPDFTGVIRQFKARYAYSMLLGLTIDSVSRKKYKNDYRVYYSFFKQGFFDIMKSHSFSKKEKAFSILLYCHLYGVVWKAKQVLLKLLLATNVGEHYETGNFNSAS